MSKNLTRKGLAFGAIVALGTSIFSGAAAHAAGQADNTFVSLAPTSGTEYSVLADGTFDLSANIAATIQNSGNVKFLVSDTTSKTRAATVSSGTSISSLASTAVVYNSGIVTVTSAGHGYKSGDSIDVAAATTLTGGAGTTGTNFTVLTATANSFTYADNAVGASTATAGTYNIVPSALSTVTRSQILSASGSQAAVGGGTLASSIGGTATDTTTFRAADGSYVVSSNSATNSADKVIRLINTDSTISTSVDVTAWVDSNGNGKIDSTEYASPTRTVKFLKNSDITPTVTLAPVSAGDQNLTAYITTSPALNGQQVGDRLGSVFTRQDSTASVAVLPTGAYNDTTKTWTASVSLATGPISGKLYGTSTAANWGFTRAIAGTGAQTSVTAAGVATTTLAGHNLRVGDKVTFTNASSGLNASIGAPVGSTVTVTSVPSSSTFTWSSTLTSVATAVTDAYNVDTYASGNSIVDRAFAGTYSAQAAIATGSTADTLVKVGAAVSNGAVAKTTSAVVVDVVASATVGRTSTTGASVLKGNNDATVVATVTDKNGAPVAAGTPVVANLVSETVVGTPTVNGSVQTAVVASTDANGQAKFVVHNASAVAGETVVLAITAEGVAPTAGNNYTLTWESAKYSIVDLSDASSIASGIRDRSAVAGGSQSFNLVVEDQFKNAAPASIRLLETLSGRTIAQLPVALTSGKATVVVADSGLTTGDTTVAFDVQSNATGTWSTDATASSWNTGTGNAGTVAVHWAAATAKDAVVLNADAASTPNGNTAAALTASTTTTVLTAADLRTNATNAAYISAAGRAVVSGIAKNSVTGAGDKGAVVTATAAGVLFNVGDVWSIGSISFLADASGYFAIYAYSSVPGAVKIAVVAGNSAAASATVTYSGAAAADAAIIKATAGATTVQAGRAVDYTVLVTDKNGLPVKSFVVKATVAGAGSFAGSAAADGSVSVTTDATGKAVVKVLYSSNDQGTATVTFADPTVGTTIASSAVSTDIGATDANIDIVGNRVSAVASYTKGKTVAFYVDGIKKWSKASTSDADVVINSNLKKGTHTVTVKISGGFSTTEKFIVK